MRRLLPILLVLLPFHVGCAAGTAVTAGTVISVGEIVVDATCIGADKLCESRDPACGSGACHVAHDVCSTLPPTAPVQVACSAH